MPSSGLFSETTIKLYFYKPLWFFLLPGA